MKPTDVLADDFFPGQIRPSVFPDIPPLLAAARGRAHKQLSHLTTDRLPEGHPRKGWDTGPLLLAIFPLLTVFAERAAPAKLHAQVSDFVVRVYREGAQKWAQSAEAQKQQ
jgi:hypothetical protein